MGGVGGVPLVADACPFIFFSSNSSSIGPGVSAVRLLVVEDSVKMAAVLKRGLEEEGYAVDVALTGEEGLWMAVEYPNDAIVLDVMLPDMDGFELCRRLRERGHWAPVLMLTARGAGLPGRAAGPGDRRQDRRTLA